jgi:hypothetical protein
MNTSNGIKLAIESPPNVLSCINCLFFGRPVDFGIPRCTINDLKGGASHAKILRDALSGEEEMPWYVALGSSYMKKSLFCVPCM